MKYRLRPYQQRAKAEVFEKLRLGLTSPIVYAATGAGKTVVGCSIIEDLLRGGLKVLFLAHRSELIEQCSRKLDEIGMEHGIIKAGMERGSFRMPLQVASVQTYVRRLERVPTHYEVLMIDECHHAAANTYQQVIEANTNGRRPIVIGLTATPYRTDGAALGDTFDCIVPVADTAQLVSEGFLVPSRIFAGRQKLELFDMREIAGDYDGAELGRRMNRPRLIGHVVEEYTRVAYGRSAVVFAVDVAHSKAITEAFCAAGIAAEHLDGTTPAGERAAIIGRLMSGKTLIVVNCGVLTEGFDCPRVSAIIAARPTKSRCLWRQMIGRGLRLCPEIGKVDCIILDHAGWRDQHGYVTDPDTVTLEGGLVKARPEPTATCRSCGAQMAGRPRLCPECGAEMGGSGDFGFTDLGDASVSLEEDLAAFLMQAPRRPAPAPYKPQAPRVVRLRARR